MKIKLFHHRPKGFTIVELSVALVMLSMISVFAGRIYLNYMNASRDLKAANLVYEEARFMMEKIVREVRQNGIDYEQYFNQNVMIPLNLILLSETETYTDNYCSYSSFFNDSGPDGDPATLGDNESRGVRNPQRLTDIEAASIDPSAVRPIENELYLINIAGNTRTILTRVEKDVNGDTIGKIAELKLAGEDFGRDHINGGDSYNGLKLTDPNCAPDEDEGDGLIDSWLCAQDYPCKRDQVSPSSTNPSCEGYTHLASNDPTGTNYSFVDISPNALNVVDLKFLVAPGDDPWKAYNMNDVQIQPNVTIQMTVEASPKLVATTTNRPPSITLTTTITARNYSEINSDCRK
jgi:prepilin-type N-terminal cleavage/methylation domain-containing protein